MAFSPPGTRPGSAPVWLHAVDTALVLQVSAGKRESEGVYLVGTSAV